MNDPSQLSAIDRTNEPLLLAIKAAFPELEVLLAKIHSHFGLGLFMPLPIGST